MDASRWSEALRAALRAEHAAWAHAPLEVLQDRGLAHLHIRLAGQGVLARIPKQSQLGLPPQANLAHQQACFERCAPSGHTPLLRGVLPVSDELPRGALLVEEIVGPVARLPADLPAMARALAAVHALPLPPRSERAPLADAADPLRQLYDEIRGQASHADAAALAPEVRHTIQDELEALRDLVERPARPQRHLIAFDAHPGNFLLRGPGDAVLVDLEKCRYSHPGLDLAHATLYTSTTWDVDTRAVLSPRAVSDFYLAWERAMPPETAVAARAWHLPLRRAMWLWSLTWCCKWGALSHQPPRAVGLGEDWSAQNSEAALVAHVRDRVDDYLSPKSVRWVRDELRQLQEGLATWCR